MRKYLASIIILTLMLSVAAPMTSYGAATTASTTEETVNALITALQSLITALKAKITALQKSNSSSSSDDDDDDDDDSSSSSGSSGSGSGSSNLLNGWLSLLGSGGLGGGTGSNSGGLCGSSGCSSGTSGTSGGVSGGNQNVVIPISGSSKPGEYMFTCSTHYYIGENEGANGEDITVDMRGRPLKSLQDFLNNKSIYVSTAVPKSLYSSGIVSYGTRIRIPALEQKYNKGEYIPFVTVDTGGALDSAKCPGKSGVANPSFNRIDIRANTSGSIQDMSNVYIKVLSDVELSSLKSSGGLQSI